MNQYQPMSNQHETMRAQAGRRIPGQVPAQAQAGHAAGDITLTVYDAGAIRARIDLAAQGKPQLSFGRDQSADVVIPSATQVVSRNHGTLTLGRNGWVITDGGSTNGIAVNGRRTRSALIGPGDVVSIGRPESEGDCVIIAVGARADNWSVCDLRNRPVTRIGRDAGCELTVHSPVVSALHASVVMAGPGRYSIQDEHSYNGTYVNGRALYGSQWLAPGDLVSVALTPMVFTGSALLFCDVRRGVEVVADDLVQVRRRKDGSEHVTTSHVSLRIGRGSFTAIVGGSGAGKSTLLNTLNGSDPATSGHVYVDGIDYYPNYDYLKNAIGYVPQQDIVHDDLTLEEMLGYAAELRMPPDATREERERRCAEVLETLELTRERKNMVGSLSGGQKKRASIAVELLADTRLLYLDEPTSGLDPGIERNLMQKLSEMAHDGRTIILVTHTTLNLHLCDQVVFLAPGGGLAFEGAPADALRFFGVSDFVPIYEIIARDPRRWVAAFAAYRRQGGSPAPSAPAGEERIAPKKNPSLLRQVSILSRRYLRLVVNDRQRLLLLLAQAPALSALICLVAGSDCFQIFESTKSCLFALSCAAFWVGILDSIQEICKERDITRREYGGGLKISAYVLSKLLVLGGLCLVQALEMCGVFVGLMGMGTLPASTVLLPAAAELFVTLALLTLSAMCLGLWVSALFSNPDRAIAVAPLLIMPQVLFSGLIFELKGISKTISWFVNCRWSMEAFGTTANLNTLDMKIYGEEVTIAASERVIEEVTVEVPETTVEYLGTQIPVESHQETLHDVSVNVPESTTTIDGSMLEHTFDEAYLFTAQHLLFDWGMLGLFCLVCTLLCALTLRRNIRR